MRSGFIVFAATGCALMIQAQPLSPVNRFNYIASTQAIGGFNQPADPAEPPLVEAAKQMRAMGTNIFKFALGPSYAKHGYVTARDPGRTYASLTQLARDSAARQVFEMPFGHYVMWTYAFSTHRKVTPWHGHMKKELLESEYQEIFDLAQYLYTTYSGTGKSFYIGNWEGDWHLLSGSPKKKHKWEQDVNPDAPQGMIDWLSTRQRAIDDARRQVPHRDVQVYFYVETNLVQKSIKQNRISVASAVLPEVNPDFVSYSSYDSTNPDKNLHRDLPAALDYMQSRLKPKPGLPEKRVFVGEYTSLAKKFTPAQQDANMRDIIATAIKWGTPFVLYWELYNNVNPKPGASQGCWLIDDKGVKQPVYYTYQAFDKDARAYVTSALRNSGHVPSTTEFQAFAYKWFTSPQH